MSDELRPTAHLLRVATGDGGHMWVMYDLERVLYGKPMEPYDAVRARWCEQHGEPEPVVTKFRAVPRGEWLLEVLDAERARWSAGALCPAR
jgi:hypothetical protein